MRWILTKLKYLFFSMMFSAAVMGVMSYSPGLRNKFMGTLMNLSAKIGANMTHALPPEMVTKFSSESPHALPVVSEINKSKQVSASANEYLIDNANYVQIEGKYYKAQKDNIYIINGQKVFFINNRRTQDEKKKDVAAAEIEEGPANRDIGYGSSDVTSAHPVVQAEARPADVHAVQSAMLKKIAAGEMLSNPSEMIQTIEEAQKSAADRNRALEKLDRFK